MDATMAVDGSRAPRTSPDRSRDKPLRPAREAGAKSTIAVELSDPALPDDLTATLDVGDFPEGFSQIWSGTMFVSDSAKPLIAWRKG